MPKSIKEKLEEEQKVTVQIPVERFENGQEDVAVPVQVNGVYMQVMRGARTEVPVSIYEALKRSGRYDFL